VYGTLGEPIVNPRLIWNFGNGESREGQTVLFTYDYPGTYTLMVTGAAGEYSAVDRVLIEAHRAMVGLEAETDGTLLLLNKEKRELDVSLWLLSRGGKSFRIPPNTIILGGGRVPFSAVTTGLPFEGEPQLLYPNGTFAVGGESEVLRVSGPAASLAAASAAFAGSGRSSYDAGQPKEATKENGEPQTQTPYEASFLWWFSGALGLGALGAASVLFMRTRPLVQGEESSVSKLADTYEIIE
jgi:PKD repeat protein